MHHGNDPEMAGMLERLYREKQDKPIGATGKYPDGKLNENDEGELGFAIGSAKGKVFISYTKPIAWVGMTPAQAISLANGLKHHALRVRAKR